MDCCYGDAADYGIGKELHHGFDYTGKMKHCFGILHPARNVVRFVDVL